MAVIKLAAPVAGIRGTVGGLTYSANKAGPFVRAWSKGANPRTTFQSTQRTQMASIPALWRLLSPAEKALWKTFAALPAQERTNSLGEAFFISGFTWFTLINIRLLNIGRVTRTAPPVQARPSAPTVSSLVLPFLPQQATKVTYPAGEFDPDFDQVIEIEVLLSSGRTVSGQTFLLLKLDQDPPDEDNDFVPSYLQRWNLAGVDVKGFVNLYRQTTDGLRSAAGTASFVSTGAAPYAALAKDYDGSTNFALRGADLTNNANSKLGTISVWFRIDAGDGTARIILDNTAAAYSLRLTTANRLRLFLFDTSPALVLDVTTTTSFTAAAAWHNVIWSFDLENAIVQLAVDALIESPIITVAPVNSDIDWTKPDHSIGASNAGFTMFDGCLSEIYFNTAEFLDLTDPDSIPRFVDPDGFPVDLGATGAFPTGAQPIVYIPAGDPAANLGYGGNYVNQAALTACSSDPP